MASYMTELKNVKNSPFQSGLCFVSYGYMVKEYGSAHYGTDYRLPTVGKSDYVCAVADGVVTEIKNDVNVQMPVTEANLKSPNATGNYVKIKHSGIHSTRYCHLEYGSIKVKVGDTVKKGEVIGIMGKPNGVSTGVHLHLDFYENGNRIDSEPYIIGTKQIIVDKAAPVVAITKITSDSLNLRQEPSTSAKILTVIPKNKTVSLSDSNCWQRVKYNGVEGWVSSIYLK